MKYLQEHCEANFRYALVRLRDHVEPIALYRSEALEHQFLKSLFLDLMTNLKQIIRRKFIVNLFDHIYKNAAIVFPFLVASPQYFNRKITLGDLIQISMAFESVHKALSFIPNSYETIVMWRSATKRLSEFDQLLDELHVAKQDSKLKLVYVPDLPSIQVKDLTVRLPPSINHPEGQIVIERLNHVFEAKKAILITGTRASVL